MLTLAFTSCTAVDQKDAFLDNLPRPVDNVIFKDDFENGLSQWTQGSGTWTTTSSGSSGLVLQSPSSTTPAAFTISTVNNLNLVGRTNCILQYDAQFVIKGVSGVSATVRFDNTIVGHFKESSGANDITSSGTYIRRRAPLPDNSLGRLTFATNVTNNTTGFADLRIDDISVTCGNTSATSVDVAYDNLNSSAANWSLQPSWAWGANVGSGSTGGLNFPTGVTAGAGNSGNWVATFAPAIDLTNRYGCRINFYYAATVLSAQNCLYLEFNGNRIWSVCNVTSSAGNISMYLTPFEGMTSNTLAFRCFDGNSSGGWGVNCTVDEVRLTCHQ